MADFFNAISGFFDFLVNLMVTVIRYFQLAFKAFSYLQATVNLLPPYVLSVVAIILAIVIVNFVVGLIKR